MPPFAETQDPITMGYDDSSFVNNPLLFLKETNEIDNDNDKEIMTNESIAATDVSVTSKVSSFYEKLLDFSVCCSFDQAEISLPNENDNDSKIQEEQENEKEIVVEKKVMSNNNNQEEGANDNDEQTHQIVNNIRMDILMRKAEEADRRNKAVAERYESSVGKSVPILVNDDDEITVPFKNNSKHKDKKPTVSMDRGKKMIPDQSKSLKTNSRVRQTTVKNPSLFVRGKKFILVKQKNNNINTLNALSTKKERWSTKYTKRLYLTKKAKAATSERGMLSNGRKRPSGMERVKKSMSLTKIKSNRTASDASSTDNKKKAMMTKRIKRSMSLTNMKSKRTTSDLPSNQKKTESSMLKRIKKSMSFKKVKRNWIKNHLSSSNQKKKKSSMTESIKKSLSLKKIKSISKKSEASLPNNKKKTSGMMKYGRKLFSFKKKIDQNKSQDPDRVGSPFEKQMNLMG